MKNFKEGEILVCIDNQGQRFITVGKCYLLLNEYSHEVGCQILNDRGFEVYYNYKRFKLLSEIRQDKLDDLLKAKD